MQKRGQLNVDVKYLFIYLRRLQKINEENPLFVRAWHLVRGGSEREKERRNSFLPLKL